MANDGKKILMFDEQTGMLTKEVMLGYVHGELSPSVRLEVEKFLSTDELHRDMLEGLKQMQDKNQVDSAIHEINQRVAERSGAELRSGGYSFEVPSFLTDYGRIAAVIAGVLLICGIVFTLMQVTESSREIASNEGEAVEETLADEALEIEPAREQTFSSAIPDTTTSVPIANNEAEVIEPQDEQLDITGGAIAAAEQKLKATDNNGGAKQNLREKTPEKTANTTKTLANDAVPTDSEAMDYKAPVVTGNADDGADEAEITTSSLSRVQEDKISLEQAKEESTDTRSETMPQFPGGESALAQYIHNNLQYPEIAKESEIQGKVYVTFTVGTSGRVKEIRVVKGVTKEINAEAIRLITNMPKWEPGKQNGKTVSMKRQLVIDFSLH